MSGLKAEQQSKDNNQWALALLMLLQQYGVTHICFAPGSRSTPLIRAARLLSLKNEQMVLHNHFDERGLGFYALGLAKASQKPVAVIVTSGTAVANLLPATVEANLTDESLILLTADRPAELVGCGANQAINQINIFSTHVRDAVYLQSPNSTDFEFMYQQVVSLLQQQKEMKGPVHINCPYPEPFYPHNVNDQTYEQMLSQLSQLNKLRPIDLLTGPDLITNNEKAQQIFLNQWSELITKKGIIITGQLRENELQQVKQLNEWLQWPLLVDPQSGGHAIWFYHDLWMQQPQLKQELMQAEVLLQFGGRLVSKRLTQFIERQAKERRLHHYWLIAPTAQPLDPSKSVTYRFNGTVSQFLTKLSVTETTTIKLKQKRDHAWTTLIYQHVYSVQKVITQWLFQRNTLYSTQRKEMNEIDLACWLQDQKNMPDLFIGNSLIVRVIDMFTQLPFCHVFSNRAASGIDGLLATAIGVQQQRKKPMICLLGDLSLLYDLNSLALCKKIVNQPFIIIVCNNDGGAIFDLLPIPNEERIDFYQLPHGFKFSHAANLFQLNYYHVTTTSELNAYYQQAIAHQGATLIELQIKPQSTAIEIASLVETIQQLECSSHG